MTYEDEHAIEQYIKLVNEFSILWKNENFIDVFMKQWMRINLRDDWQSKIFEKFKIYSLSIEDQKIVDETFDKMHDQDRLKWTDTATLFSYSVFVIWIIKDEVKKDRAVIDIRDLNELIMSDAYSMSSQSEIIRDLLECTHLAVLDANFFFYQWRVHSDDTYMLIAVISRDQKTFLVSIMRCRNSIAYVQRQMNIILRKFRDFVRTYIDDVIIKSRSFKDHLNHLRSIFTLFTKLRIFIKSIKIFLDYADVLLLRQRVNALDLTISKEKLRVIAMLQFSDDLVALEKYLEITDYLRKYIYFYAEISKSLQNLKTKLLKNSSKRNQRKSYISRVKITFIDKEMHFYKLLQKALSNSILLVHFDRVKNLWIDLDSFKKFDFDVIIFHVKKDISKDKWPTKSDIESIAFLSRLLIKTELNYWPTKMKTACLIWVIRKIRHMIQFCEKNVIVQTDHFFIIDIAKQKSITITNSIMRLNLRLVRASQFLSQFSNLDIRHKSEKYYVISNALSRLKSLNISNVENDDYSELNALYTYHIILLELNEEFMTKIIHEYINDEAWKKIIEIIDKNDKLEKNVAKLHFIREDAISRNSSEIDSYFQSRSKFEVIEKLSENSQISNDKRLIYHINRITDERRLCISSNCVKEIFDIAHEESHSRFNICFEIIFRSWYIRDLTRQLRNYIRHCSECLIMQTRRHKSWENFQSIDSSSMSFHTITLNFILVLSFTPQELDCILSITD